MDVSLRRLDERRWWWLALALACGVGLLLRLRGIHSPLLDHPGWRQGDTAAIARNFATLNFNIFFPQTEYNGAPPNYVELELQIVPFLAAILYKIFGVHEVFGRLIAIGFGLGTIALVGAFARWLFESAFAGIIAAVCYAVLPGAIYYSRTFQPDGAMVFFLTAALYAGARWIVDDDARGVRFAAIATALLAAAFLAKQVALIALIPLATLAVVRFGARGIVARPLLALLLLGSLVPLACYQPYVASHAEWHWASGIMRLHVIPSLLGAFTSGSAFVLKAKAFGHAIFMLGSTMAGPIALVTAAVSFVFLRSRANGLLYGWLAAGVLYAYVVVTVERVDYYLYPLLPLVAIVAAGGVGRYTNRIVGNLRPGSGASSSVIVTGVIAATWIAVIGVMGLSAIKPYYTWRHDVYGNALALDHRLPPDALIVMAHYDPSVMYYIHRKGWMEDPYLWTPFDEQSAIRKGSRYFIAIEKKRLARNVELSHWLERFPVDQSKTWPVYETDPAKLVPGAEARWRAFRDAERSGSSERP